MASAASTAILSAPSATTTLATFFVFFGIRLLLVALVLAHGAAPKLYRRTKLPKRIIWRQMTFVMRRPHQALPDFIIVNQPIPIDLLSILTLSMKRDIPIDIWLFASGDATDYIAVNLGCILVPPSGHHIAIGLTAS